MISQELIINYINEFLFNKELSVIFISIFLLFFIRLFTNFFKNNFFGFFIFSLPGTILHEFAHLFIGILTFAKPVNFSLIPKKSDNGYTLGSVSFTNIKWFNAIPIAFAPILLIPFNLEILYQSTLFLNKYYLYSLQFNLFSILIGSVIFSSIYSSIPSGPDFRVALSSKIGIFFYISLITLILNKYYLFWI